MQNVKIASNISNRAVINHLHVRIFTVEPLWQVKEKYAKQKQGHNSQVSWIRNEVTIETGNVLPINGKLNSQKRP